MGTFELEIEVSLKFWLEAAERQTHDVGDGWNWRVLELQTYLETEPGVKNFGKGAENCRK